MIEPRYQSDRVTLYCADCLEVLPQLEAGSVDLAVMSPPYNCRKSYGTFKDEMPWKEYYAWINNVIGESYRILINGGVVAINIPGVIRWQADHEYSATWLDYDAEYKTHRNGKKVVGKGRIEPLGFRIFEMMQSYDKHIREPIIWVKGSDGNAICSDYRMGCDSDPYMRPAHEWILVGSKAQWFHRGGTGRRGREAVPFMDFTKDVWFIPPGRSNGHPATFPQELPERIIRIFTHAADSVVIDPFMGEGTSIMASLEMGRKAIGIEIDPTYYAIAEKRIRAAEAQLLLGI
jgi:site-specific DNA-methyltransferase (adenine-specific)